nr:InlB B-repeat-containing protein [Candidatus Saccharibacteria bacterium]
VIRLYDPDAIEAIDSGMVMVNYDLNYPGAPTLRSQTGRKVTLPSATRPNRIFKGWCEGVVSSSGDSCAGTLHSANKILVNNNPGTTKTYSLKAVWEDPKYTITYNFNGGNANGIASTQICYYSAIIAGNCRIPSKNPTRPGHIFNKWCTTTPTNYFTTCSSASYSSGGLISLALFPSGRTATLHAVWIERYIQDYSVASCRSEASSANQTLVDKRDHSTYTVRYANNQCWMTQDLHIGYTNSGKVSAAGSNFSNPGIWNINVTSNKSYTQASANVGSSWGYYNFCAATAGSNNGCTKAEVYSGTSDICPANWRMPNGTELDNIKGNRNIFSLSSSSDGSAWWSTSQTPYLALDDDSKLQRALIRRGDDFKFNPDYGWGTSSIGDGGYFRTNRMRIRCVHK